VPIRYTIDNKQKAVFTRLYGTLTLQECIDHHRRLEADPDFDSAYCELIDGGDVENIGLNSAGIFELSSSCPFDPPARRAIYTTERSLHFGIARMFQALAGGKRGDIQVFRELDKAIAWLGVEPPSGD